MAYIKLYEDDFLIAKIKELDADLEMSTSQSRVNTMQDEQEFREDVKAKQAQRDYYYKHLRANVANAGGNSGVIALLGSII